MVDVGAKPETERVAIARAVVRMTPETAAAVAAGDAPKGDVVGVARLAAIQAAKRTDELIPLAPLAAADLRRRRHRGRRRGGHGDRHDAPRASSARTGVEMEAMVGCAAARSRVYDMVKGIERGVVRRAGRAAGEDAAGDRGRGGAMNKIEPLRDGHGRCIGDVRVSVTDRCNFRCQYCMPAEGLPWLERDERPDASRRSSASSRCSPRWASATCA